MLFKPKHEKSDRGAYLAVTKDIFKTRDNNATPADNRKIRFCVVIVYKMNTNCRFSPKWL